MTEALDTKIGPAGAAALLSVVIACTTLVPLANIGAYPAMILALLAGGLLVLRPNSFRMAAQPFVLCFLGAFLLIAISISVSARSAGDYLYIFDFLPLLLAILVYRALNSVPANTIIRVISGASLVGTGAALAMGLYQVIMAGEVRADGIGGGSAIHFGNISLLLGALSILPFLWTRKAHWIFWAGPLMGAMAALLSGTRAAVFVAAALVIVAAVHIVIGRRATLRLSHVLMAVAAIAGLAVIGVTLSSGRLINTFTTLADLIASGKTSDIAMSLRIDMWQAGLRAFVDAPLFGHGWHYVQEATEAYRARPDYRIQHLHNDVLNFATALGLFGVFAYALLLVAPAIAGLRAKRKSLVSSFAISAFIATFFIAGLTNVTFFHEAPKVAFCFLAAAVAALASAVEREPAPLNQVSGS